MSSSVTDIPVESTQLQVIIVGGSLSGLLHGLMLKRLGHNVRILERTPHALEHQAAGIGTGPVVQQFLKGYDRIDAPFAVPCDGGILTIDGQDRELSLFPLPLKMTSWDSLYFRLRSNFDGFRSGHYPNPPSPGSSDGRGEYLLGCKLTDVAATGQDVTAFYENVRTGSSEQFTADLLIGADGPDSMVRQLMIERPPPRKYVGYILWRGLVKETDVSDTAQSLLEKSFTFYSMRGEYVVVYPIPGDNGSLVRGERYFNLAWYRNQSSEQLKETMTDRNGKLHTWTMPIGLVQDSIWAEAKTRANQAFSPALTELINKIEQPFIQVISDHYSPQASFHGGKVVLVGDAQNLLRPHSGSGLNQAAKHCLWLTEYLRGKISMAEWERRCLEEGHVQSLMSVWWGYFYMYGRLLSAPYAARYFVALQLQKLKDWWYIR